MTDGLTTAMDKLGIPRLFRYFASGLTIALVTLVVNPDLARRALDELKCTLGGELETSTQLIAILTIGLVGNLIVRNVLGRLLLHRVQDIAAWCCITKHFEPTIFSHLKGNKCWLVDLSTARTTYSRWRRNLGQPLRDRLDLAHAEIDLLYLVGTTWLGARFALCTDPPAGCSHYLIGGAVLLAAIFADWRQHQYEFVLFQEDHGLGVAERSKLRRLYPKRPVT